MNCRDLKLNISLYIDEMLGKEQSDGLAIHLDGCAECRALYEKLIAVKRELASIEKPAIPRNLLASIRSNVSVLAESRTGGRMFAYETEPVNWRNWALPSLVGSLATLLITFSALSAILSGSANVAATYEIAASRPAPSRTTTMLAGPELAPINGDFELSANEYADLRVAVAGESPSLNPHGALVALTRSLVRGDMKDDELTVVADVFGNGIAKIAEVIEPSDDRRAIEQLDKALRSDPQFAPFVPAEMDNRSETMRVVLKIQSVNVDIDN